MFIIKTAPVQMIGASHSERLFMSQIDSFGGFRFILNCRHCAVSVTYHAVYRHLLPKTSYLLPADLAKLS